MCKLVVAIDHDPLTEEARIAVWVQDPRKSRDEHTTHVVIVRDGAKEEAVITDETGSATVAPCAMCHQDGVIFTGALEHLTQHATRPLRPIIDLGGRPQAKLYVCDDCFCAIHGHSLPQAQ